MLDYEYTKNHHKLIAIDLGREEELDAGTNEIQQTEFVGQLKKKTDNGLTQLSKLKFSAKKRLK